MPIITRQTAPVTNSKLYGLDHLRAFAITFVFLYHYSVLFPHPDWMYTIGKFGWTGVDLFFVLSGYLIASQLFREISDHKKILLKAFFLKRFFRIIPAYLVVVAIYFLLPFVREREAPAPLWKYLTFTQNLGLDLHTQGTFSHAWSLCIEEQFYLILPFVLVLLASLHMFKKSFWLLIVLFLSGFVIRYYAYQIFVTPHLQDDNVYTLWYKAIYYPTYCRLDGLITGVAIAAMSQYLPLFTKRITKSGNLLLLVSICILTGAYFLCSDQISFNASVFGFPLVSIGYGTMVLGAISPTSFLYTFQSKVTATIAALSYALYLIHKFMIHSTQVQLEKLHIAAGGNAMFLLCLTACLSGAVLMNKIVEKPFLKLRNKLLRTK